MDNYNSFYSIDRLMEFGLGLGVAQQMVQAMNQAMNNMHVPGSVNTIPRPQTEYPIYVVLNDAIAGPFSTSEFGTLVRNGSVNKDSLVWLPGMNAWEKVQSVPSVLKIIALTPPPVPKRSDDTSL